MARSDRKQKLYDLGKEALSRLLGRDVPGYVCPICLNYFEGLDNLTEEHVPPKSIGGEVLCLTCRECNCGAGHGVDAHVDREKLGRSFLAADGQVRRAKIVVQGIRANVDVRRDEKGIQIQVLGGENDPKAVGALQPVLRDGIQSGSSFQLRDTVSFSRKEADIGYLSSAYLAAFAKLGYTYILRAALDRVRQQIQDPTCRALETVRVYAGDFGGTERAFFLLDEPISCLAAKIRDSVVCLPSPYGDDHFYEELTSLRGSGGRVTWRRSEAIRWPDRFELALDFAEEEDHEGPTSGCG